MGGPSKTFQKNVDGLKRRLSDEIDSFVLEEEIVPEPPVKRGRTNFEIAEKWRRREKHKEKSKAREVDYTRESKSVLVDSTTALRRRKRVVMDALESESTRKASSQIEGLFEGVSQ